MHQGLSRLWLALVLAAFCLPLFAGLGRTDLRGDEAIYSFGVDRILEIGDWLAPRSSPNDDTIFLEKPPLKFWIVAAPIRFGLLPHNEFGLRFWDAFFGGAAFLYVFAIGRRLAGPMCGASAVLILFVHGPLLFEHGLRSNNMEAPLFLSYCGGVYHYLAWAGSEARRPGAGHAVGVALYFVLGFMTKFVAALFLPLVLAASTLIVPTYRARFGRDWKTWLGAALLTAMLVVPWFVYAHYRFGAIFWRIIFSEHVYARFTGYLDPTHLHPWNHYVVELYKALKYSESLLIAGLGAVLFGAYLIRYRRPEGVVLLLWFALPVSLMSLTTSKLYHYAYPFLPPVAVAAGYVPAFLLSTLQPRVRAALGAFGRRPSAEPRYRWLGALQRPRSRVVLLSLAGAVMMLAVATLVYGPIRVTTGRTVWFRNSGVLRPWLVALALALLGGRPEAIGRFGVPLLIIWLLPLPTYRQTLVRSLQERHPLRSARDCTLQVQTGSGASLPRGLYVDAEDVALRHEDFYYFRRIRPWQRAAAPSDDTLYTYLNVPTQQRPVLIAETRYREFMGRLRSGNEHSREDIARVDADHRASVQATRGVPASPAMVTLPEALLLLPGPYSVCAADTKGQRLPSP